MHWISKAAIVLALTGGLASRPAADEPQEPKDQASAPAPMPRVPGPGAETEPQASASPLKNTVRWKTNNLNNYGYDVFRAEAESGPFRKLTAQLLPGGGKGADKNEFEYVDATIEPDQAYWYYVEAVDLMGKRSKFTPTIKAEPKHRADPAAATAPR